jgi:hypothetical protein
MTMASALSTRGRSLGFGPFLMHMDAKLLAGRPLLKFLNLLISLFT